MQVIIISYFTISFPRIPEAFTIASFGPVQSTLCQKYIGNINKNRYISLKVCKGHARAYAQLEENYIGENVAKRQENQRHKELNYPRSVCLRKGPSPAPIPCRQENTQYPVVVGGVSQCRSICERASFHSHEKQAASC